MIGSTGVAWVDVLIVLVLLAYAVSGFRAGILVSASSLAGFLAGGALALWVLPRALAHWAGWADVPPLLQWIGLLVVLLGSAALGQFLGLRLGHRLRRGVRSSAGATFDALGGGLLVVLTTAMVLWFLGGAARLTGSSTLSAVVGRSAILAAVDRTIPVPVGTVLAGLNTVMTGQGFPQVFGGVAREPITSVQTPDDTVALAPGVQAAGASIVRIDGQASTCRTALEGTGWVVADDYVVTNAHVVAGTDRVAVTSPGTRRPADAVVVHFDPRTDLAILHVPGLTARPLTLGEDVERGDSVAVAGYPLAGPYAVEPARVRDRLVARGLDITGREEVTRDVYSLRAPVQPGNSGGPVLDEQGRVVGVVFARSLDDPDTGYALTLAEVSRGVAMAVGETRGVATGACVKAG